MNMTVPSPTQAQPPRWHRQPWRACHDHGLRLRPIDPLPRVSFTDMGLTVRLSTRRSCPSVAWGFGKSQKKKMEDSDTSVQSPPPANSFPCPRRAWIQDGSWSHLVRGLASSLRRPLRVLHFPSIWHSPMCRGPEFGGTRDLWTLWDLSTRLSVEGKATASLVWSGLFAPGAVVAAIPVPARFPNMGLPPID